MLRGRDHQGGPGRRDRRGGETEALRSIVGRHCSSLGVRRGVQLTESAERGSSLRVQTIVGFWTRSNVVLRNVGVGRKMARSLISVSYGQARGYISLSNNTKKLPKLNKL